MFLDRKNDLTMSQRTFWFMNSDKLLTDLESKSQLQEPPDEAIDLDTPAVH